jgi:hypothetical protein
MKKKNTISYIWLMVLAFILALPLSGCGKKSAGKYGQEISNQTLTKVEEILKEIGSYDGKTVTVKGRIIRECPTGCWLEVQEDAGIIYIDLNPSGFAIPQKVGKTATVEGKVLTRNNRPMILGTGVEIK